MLSSLLAERVMLWHGLCGVEGLVSGSCICTFSNSLREQGGFTRV